MIYSEKTVGLFSGPRLEMEADWKVCRVLRGGTRALREAREEFTPLTAREREQPDAYTERLKSSVLYDVYRETVSRIAALPFERPPVVKGREDLEPELDRLIDDADRQGTSMSVFFSTIYQDAIDRGLGMFLVENVPIAPGTPLPEADRMDARPYLCRIDPDNFLGCETETRNGREVCTLLRVREWQYRPAADGIGDDLFERVRVYTGTDVTVWERPYSRTAIVSDRAALGGNLDKSADFAQVEAPVPTGFPNGEIPLIVIYSNRIGFLHAKPALLQLAYLNLKHWNQQSVLDAALRYSGMPLLFGAGFTTEDAERRPKTGEGARIMTSDPNAKLSFVEIAGTSLQMLAAQIDKTEARMKSAAAEPLMKSSATATGEVRSEMRDQSEAQRWIEAMEWAIYRAFQMASEWLGVPLPESFNVSLHRASSLMQVANPIRTQALKADVDQGYITLETYLAERARSGDFSDDFDPSVEAEAVMMQKERSQQAQMDALLRQVQAERQPPPQDDSDDPDSPDDVPQDRPPQAGAA